MTAITGASADGMSVITLDLDTNSFKTTLGDISRSLTDVAKTLGDLVQDLARQAQALSDRGVADAFDRQLRSNQWTTEPVATTPPAEKKPPEKKEPEKKAGGQPEAGAPAFAGSSFQLPPLELPGGAAKAAQLVLPTDSDGGGSGEGNAQGGAGPGGGGTNSGEANKNANGEQKKGEENKVEFKTAVDLGNEAIVNTKNAREMLTDNWRLNNFAKDKSNVDLEMAKLYYEYSLSMEQRLSLARVQGLKGVTDGFAGMINDVLFGHQQIGDSFRKMIGGWAKSMADFMSKFLAQKAILGLLKYIGLGDFLGLGGASKATGGTQTSELGATFLDSTADVPIATLTAHSGGVIGGGSLEGPKASRAVPASLFADAARPPDGGLIRGEVPIVAKAGEAVFTPEQMSNADQLLKSALTASAGSQINQTVNVTVNGNGGSPEQNADLADRIGWQVKEELRGMMAEEMRQQMRPGGLLNGGY